MSKDQKKVLKNADLLSACASGDHETVEELLRSGDATILATRNGCSALHVAVRHGHPSVVRVLISHNANVDAVNRYGDTALIIASVRGDEKCVKILVEANADKTIQNKEGKTAFACSKLGWNRKLSFVSLLVPDPLPAA
eukprot:CAMPEP_0197540288 /NCGR_PEP_ID=MMETSP1318-20131121/65349_1 /TAXON_ID=552666 /ORGANISM="Partenskyella glossopodia, Strain RCC365" /LENGTH=138 /DNA_ID=CAMNT_0043099229 /DNA_START=65 /DNA_END=481 /DNA_ORIENTATION=+